MKRDFIELIAIVMVVFLIFSITYFNTYFKFIPENYVPWIIVGLVFFLVPLMYVLRKETIPSELVKKYLPLPLALISPPSAELERQFKARILPAMQAVIGLTKTESREKAYAVIKHIREFFNRELKGVNLGSTESVRKRLAEMKLYSNVSDENERKNFQYSLASLITWISRYRNLVMHSIDPDPIDVWFALRASLIYIRSAYPQENTPLYTRCPKCNAINVIKLYDGKVHWLQKLSVNCTKCKQKYEVKITPTTIAKHYQILNTFSQP